MFRTHMPRRIGNAVRIMKEEIARHAKTDPENVKIGGELNRYLMLGAIQGFYGVKVEVEKTGDMIKIDLAEKRKQVAPAPAAKESKAKAGEKAQATAPAPKTEEKTTAHAKAEPAKKEKKEVKPKAPKQEEAPKV